MTQTTDSFITQAEALIESTKIRLETGRNPSGRQVYIADDEDRMRDLATALRSLLGEYKRLTAEQEWEYMARNRAYLRRGLSEDEALAWRARGYKVWKRTPGRNPGEWVPVEGEDQ